MKYYRFMCNSKGIYEQVDIDCPKGSPCRDNKPDGAWLNKVGQDFPGAISFFTEAGVRKYQESGLKDWHASVVKGEVEILTGESPTSVLYEDEYQIIVLPENIVPS